MSEEFDIKRVPTRHIAQAWAAMLINGLQKNNPVGILNIAEGGEAEWIKQAGKIDKYGLDRSDLKFMYAQILRAAKRLGFKKPSVH